MSTINAGTTLTTAFTITSDTTGALDLATGGTVRLTLASTGAFGLAGDNYGTSGQVLTSNGSSAAPSWQSAASGAQDFIIQFYGIV